MPVFRIHFFHHIEGNGILLVGRIEVNNIIDAAGGNRFDQSFGKFPVGIHNRHSVAILDILNSHILDHGRFSRSGLADHIKMASAIIHFDAERPVLSPKIGFGKGSYFFHKFSYPIGKLTGAPPFFASTLEMDGDRADISGK